MSDYFGALMRSGGMAIGGRALAIPQLPSVEPSVVDIDVEGSPPAMPQRTVQAASTRQQAVAPALEASDSAVPEVPAVQSGFAPTPRALLRAAVDAPAAEPSVAPPAAALEAPKPALGQVRVRAAMRWVAADPQQDRGAAQVAPPRGLSWPAVTEETAVITTTHPIRAREVEPEAQPPIATPAEPVAPARSTPRETVPAQELPIRPARLSPATLPVPVAPLDRGEVVEISIGAIHVRVDAPAAQTVARPPATPPVPAPGATGAATTPRSALSRRALRRI